MCEVLRQITSQVYLQWMGGTLDVEFIRCLAKLWLDIHKYMVDGLDRRIDTVLYCRRQKQGVRLYTYDIRAQSGLSNISFSSSFIL